MIAEKSLVENKSTFTYNPPVTSKESGPLTPISELIRNYDPSQHSQHRWIASLKEIIESGDQYNVYFLNEHELINNGQKFDKMESALFAVIEDDVVEAFYVLHNEGSKQKLKDVIATFVSNDVQLDPEFISGIIEQVNAKGLKTVCAVIQLVDPQSGRERITIYTPKILTPAFIDPIDSNVRVGIFTYILKEMI